MELANYSKVLSVSPYAEYHKYPYTTVDNEKKIKEVKDVKGGKKYKSYKSTVQITYY